MAYSDFGPPRRSRRRRNVVVLIVLVLIIGVLALAVRYRTERRESIDYLATAEEVATKHSELADRLGALLQGLGQEERPEVAQRLETLALESRGARRQLEAVVVTRPVAEVAGLMMVSVAAWDDAIRGLDDAIVAILDAEDGDLTGDEALREAFELLRLGDRAYTSVLDGVVRLDQELVSKPFPIVTYTGGQYAALYDAPTIADRLRRLGGLSELSDIAILGATIPAPVSKGVGEIWSIPASDRFDLEVTVSNTGNVIAEKISVVVTLKKERSSETIPPLGQLITSIDPQDSKQILFEDLDVEPGQVYSVTVTASLEAGDDAAEDNIWSLIFERNAE
ncbi:MAG: hypothetical protein U9N84_14005 [Actinomycetota bacterium]|nr:hypothetical protein [Actinomycetota bacterium]